MADFGLGGPPKLLQISGFYCQKSQWPVAPDLSPKSLISLSEIAAKWRNKKIGMGGGGESGDIVGLRGGGGDGCYALNPPPSHSIQKYKSRGANFSKNIIKNTIVGRPILTIYLSKIPHLGRKFSEKIVSET